MELFRMPRVALNDDEVMVLSSWIIAEGDPVAEGIPVVEVETAKANMEVEAPSSGVLALQLRAAGAEVSPGDVIGVIAEVGEIVDPAALGLDEPPSPEASASDATNPDATRPETAQQPTAQQHTAQPHTAQPHTAQPHTAQPHTAQPHTAQPDAGAPDAGAPTPAPDARDGISASAALVVAVEQATASAIALPDAAVTSLHRRAPRAASGFLVGSFAARGAARRTEHRPTAPRSFGLSRHRQALGRLMTASAAIPQFSVHADVPADGVSTLVGRLRTAGVNATFTDVLLKAAAVALGQHPRFNSQFNGSELLEFDRASIGIAVDTDSGVLAPVIHDVDTLSWHDLSRTRGELVERARAGRVPPSNLSGGTFSISNVGPLGAHVLVPMITPPQTAIIGIAAVHPTAAGDVFTAVVVADHRVHDGADAARFLSSFADALGNPDRLMLS